MTARVAARTHALVGVVLIGLIALTLWDNAVGRRLMALPFSDTLAIVCLLAWFASVYFIPGVKTAAQIHGLTGTVLFALIGLSAWDRWLTAVPHTDWFLAGGALAWLASAYFITGVKEGMPRLDGIKQRWVQFGIGILILAALAVHWWVGPPPQG